MRRRKTKAEKFRDGDTRQRGAKKLAAQLAAEPRTERGLECPARLKGDARDLFLFYAAQLEASRLDSRVDSPSLACACENLALSWRAQRALEREGPIRKIPVMIGLGRARRRIGSRQVRNRWFAIKIECEKQFARIAGNFGLIGAASRSGLEVQTPRRLEESGELWRLLNMPRPPKPKPGEVPREAEGVQ